jgi:hypothetical protein
MAYRYAFASTAIAAGLLLAGTPRAATDEKGVPASLRMRAYRSDPDSLLLGPLKATHFGLGDVAGLDTRLSGSAASGRGAMVTNRPVVNPTAFDRTRSKAIFRPAGKRSCIATASFSVLPGPTAASATCSKTCS